MPIFLVNSALPSDRNSTFSLPPDFSSQAASTNGSFTAMHVTRSTPCFLVVGALDEARQMLEMAGRGEGTRHGEQNDALAGEHVLGGQDLESVGSCDTEGRLGQAGSNFNRHAVFPERMAVAVAPYRLAQARPRELLRRPGGLARTLIRDEDQLERLSLDGGSLLGRGEGHGKALFSGG